MNITTNDHHVSSFKSCYLNSQMWLIPFTAGSDHLLTISFTQPTALSGIKIYNYNKSLEDTARGVRWSESIVIFTLAGQASGHITRR